MVNGVAAEGMAALIEVVDRLVDALRGVSATPTGGRLVGPTWGGDEAAYAAVIATE